MRLTLNQRPEAVTEARKRAGLTKTALARAVGCSLSLISEIEGGTRNARAEILAQIALATDVPIAKLRADDAGETGETAPPTTDAVPDVRDEQRAVSGEVPELRNDAHDTRSA